MCRRVSLLSRLLTGNPCLNVYDAIYKDTTKLYKVSKAATNFKPIQETGYYSELLYLLNAFSIIFELISLSRECNKNTKNYTQKKRK